MQLIDLDAPLESDPVIEAYKKHVDRTLLRENLKLTVQQRLDKHERALRVMEEAKRAGQEASRRR
jgi:hypothetical protein